MKQANFAVEFTAQFGEVCFHQRMSVMRVVNELCVGHVSVYFTEV